MTKNRIVLVVCDGHWAIAMIHMFRITWAAKSGLAILMFESAIEHNLFTTSWTVNRICG